MVPYTLDANDMRFATPQGFNSGQQFFDYLKDSFDVLHAEGGRMMSIGLHCRLAGRPGRAAAVARFLEYVLAQDKVWLATRVRYCPSLARTASGNSGVGVSDNFVRRYGGIYEHSPWVAEQVKGLLDDGAVDMGSLGKPDGRLCRQCFGRAAARS